MKIDAKIETEEQRLRPAGSEVRRLWADNTTIRELTGYEPAFSLRTGLTETISWFLNPNNLGKYKPEIYNV